MSIKLFLRTLRHNIRNYRNTARRTLINTCIDYDLARWSKSVVYTPREIIQLVDSIRAESEILMSYDEALRLFLIVQSINKLPDDAAEIGVFKGGSAKIILEAQRRGGGLEKKLHLFDTFQGHPYISEIDKAGGFKKGLFNAPVEKVMHFLSSYENACFHKGVFPDTAESVKDSTFSFVHFAADLYITALNTLEFFYPRLTKSGVMLFQNPSSPPVKKALEEFLADKPEPVIGVSYSQAIVVKL